ncbi:MAG: phosphoenolpyruvate carboxykinase (ATP) [Candidatus Sumerlaeia bacterium]|nr:phosphoenolpyruvate carboxykinase (ATP) [Candidatus Sumerlaeia bacterium]
MSAFPPTSSTGKAIASPRATGVAAPTEAELLAHQVLHDLAQGSRTSSLEATPFAESLAKQGIRLAPHIVHRNPSVAKLYRMAAPQWRYHLANSGALIAYSTPKTGRSPKDKRVVREETTEQDVWWGHVNIPLSEASFAILKETAQNYLNSRDEIYVIDAFAGWDPKHRVKVRVICTRAYHALFMWNMLIRPTPQELADFGDPDWVIYNGGQLEAPSALEGVGSKTCVALNFRSREFVILGTEYAGEMKKGVFTILNYTLPRDGVLSMHCSANEGPGGDTALFFGLSGTGKTTLSADPKRALIGDDEHGWTDGGIFNFEGGCYAKTINLSREGEPQIWSAIRYGAILENVVYDPETFQVDYTDASVTENTRCSYPIEFIDHAKIPCTGGHPRNIIFLTCDAFGVLPPVSRLTAGQAMYHFISGYTAKVAGTEIGVTEPQATFSACFGAAFLVWHPTKYAEMLAEKIRRHGSRVWLVNTGWTGGGHGTGHRFKLAHTRAIIDAILDGSLDHVEFRPEPHFGLAIPASCPDVPPDVLDPRRTWMDKAAYDETVKRLAAMFRDNFAKYADRASQETLDAAPKG